MTLGSAITRSLMAAIVIAVALSSSHSAELPSESGWPQWRGPGFDGLSTETRLADSWPDAGPPVLWTRELGQGYSSFVAVGPHVFTQVQTLYEQAVVCLDADTGRTIWSTRYGWPYEGGGLYPGPRSTPAWHRGRVYFAAPDGMIGCLDAGTGAFLWSVNPTRQFHGQGTDFGYSCSPVIADEKLFVPVGGKGASVVALNIQDGSVAWSAGDSPASYASPLPIKLGNRHQVIALLENSLAAFDLKTGQLLWEEDLSEGYDEHSAAPLYREPFLMFAGPFRSGAKCLKLPETDGARPTRVWDSMKFSNDIASSVLVDGRIYGFDLKDVQSRVNRPSRGEYRCLDFETGKIIWSSDKPGHANVIVADGKLVLFNDRGEVILARLGTSDYEELARAQVFRDEICWSSPALHQGRLFLRTQTRAACLYLGQAALNPAKPLQSVADIPQSQSVDWTPLLGGEREFPATAPEWSEFLSWYGWSVSGIAAAAIIASLITSLFHLMVLFRRQPKDHVARAGATISAEPQITPGQNSTGPSSLRSPTFDLSVRSSLFWLMVLVFGATGSPFLNRWRHDYVFLWPLVLWAAMQMTANTIDWAEHQPDRRSARWRSRGAGLLFLGIDALYFHLCRKLGLSIEWGFLSGLLPGFVVAALVAYEHRRPSRCRTILDGVFAILSFTIYFWSSALLIKWSLRVGS